MPPITPPTDSVVALIFQHKLLCAALVGLAILLVEPKALESARMSFFARFISASPLSAGVPFSLRRLEGLGGPLAGAFRARPITPGAVVVCPLVANPVERISELSEAALLALFETALQAMAAAERPPAEPCDAPAHTTTDSTLPASAGPVKAFNLALRDGPRSGAPFPHLHLHVVPRRKGDFHENDVVYGMIDRWHPDPGRSNSAEVFPEPESRDRRPPEVMALEAAELRRIWTNAGEEGSNPGSVTARRAALAALPETLPFSDRIGISRETVFFATKLSIAFVNISPLVPGHVLVVPRRVEPRLLGLDADERADLWRSVRAVEAVLGVWRSERALEKATHVSRGARTARQRRKGFDSEAATVGDGSSRERGELGGESGQRGGTRPEDVTYRIGVQDGAVAGQTVPHVHVHILPMLP